MTGQPINLAGLKIIFSDTKWSTPALNEAVLALIEAVEAAGENAAHHNATARLRKALARFDFTGQEGNPA